MPEDNSLSPEDALNVINWAVSAGAMLHILYNMEDNTATPEEIVQFHQDHFLNILQAMPEVIIEEVVEWADECYENAVVTEKKVEEFVQELDKVKPEDFDTDGRE